MIADKDSLFGSFQQRQKTLRLNGLSGFINKDMLELEII